MEVLKPRKDRYNPDNVYRIYINIGNHPGAKWVSFKDKNTGEVSKGIFIPDVETGGSSLKSMPFPCRGLSIRMSLFLPFPEE